MTPEDCFNEQYIEGSTPWDIGKPDFNLVQTVTTTPMETRDKETGRKRPLERGGGPAKV